MTKSAFTLATGGNWSLMLGLLHSPFPAVSSLELADQPVGMSVTVRRADLS